MNVVSLDLEKKGASTVTAQNDPSRCKNMIGAKPSRDSRKRQVPGSGAAFVVDAHARTSQTENVCRRVWLPQVRKCMRVRACAVVRVDGRRVAWIRIAYSVCARLSNTYMYMRV